MGTSMKKIFLFVSIGVFLFVFGFLAGSFWTTLRLSELPILKEIRNIQTEKESSYFSPEESFWETKYFGGMIGRAEKMQTIPEGEGVFEGRLLFKGKGAKEIKLKLFFNGKYKTNWLTTDESGLFKVNIPEGKWYLNMLQCEAWENKPEGDFVLISGDEPKLDQVYFQNLFFSYSDRGKEFIITDQKPIKEHITLRINPRIRVEWPEDNIPKQHATIASSRIMWRPYPGAAGYVVQISRVTRESSRSTIYSPINYKKITGRSFLPLSDLEFEKDPAHKEEYVVSMRAYGEQGELLSESEHSFGSSFTLMDGNVLVENEELTRSPLDGGTIEKVYQNTKYVHTIETLIKEQMFIEAEKLLEKLKDDTIEMKGKKQLLTGYLYAAQGNCLRANEFFDRALESGQKCIPKSYRANCK